jgi:fatty aldehyde-generating acyl-ACP reductase
MASAIAAVDAPTVRRPVDFALIGHLDHWDRASALLNSFRPGQPPIEREEIASLLPWIPPRAVCRVRARSIRNHAVEGVYIDCFISPDELDVSFARRNIQRVRAAAAAAARDGARVATLGGFSSIVLEGDIDGLPGGGTTAFTTGNTLTAAYIIAGVEAALRERGTTLESQRVLIIGSTGDIGCACVAYLSRRVRELLLTARNASRLQRQLQSLGHTSARASTDLAELLPLADVIISVASTSRASLDLRNARPDAVICDAGYPPNVSRFPDDCDLAFHGGMGQIIAGYEFDPPSADVWRGNTAEGIAHGCLLEAVLLALEGRFESFSAGRGRITPERIDEIYAIAMRHGCVVAPLAKTRLALPKGHA